MAKQTINIGASPNDGTGTPLRTAFDYTNQNFTELYTATGPSGNNIVVPGSATITGDLAVDTSTLKVDSANDRVGIKNATPSFPLDLTGTGSNTPFRLLSGSGTSIRFDTTRNVGGANRNWIFGCDEYAEGTFALAPSTALGGATFTNPVYTVTSGGIHTFLDGAGGTRMTLNSTGLGVGVTPSYKLDVSTGGALNTAARLLGNDQTNVRLRFENTGASGRIWELIGGLAGSNNRWFSLRDVTGSTTPWGVDDSMNVISNVTGTAPTLATNSQMVFNLTSNTNLRISVRGTDGTTRTANITLA